ncbi:hypothetical protein L1887_14537 [Cichorium endivia]|nr:hypothetical protein L1887_14537 [Cichorium endivia]
MKEINEELMATIRSIIDKRIVAMKAGETSSDDLLGILLDSNYKEIKTHGNRSFGLSIEEVIEECKIFYFAGQETTANMLVWTMILLGLHTDWQTRARDEVLQLFGKRKPDIDGLNHLKTINMIFNEVSIEKLAMKSAEDREEEISYAAELTNVYLRTSKGTLLMSSRELITGTSELWAGRSTEENKDKSIYILAKNAEKGGYAIGAFNVYNLEGVEAVIAAAEEQNSPAILQIHPSALKQGGKPLVACCISAAEQATVPITVYFDHGSSKQELMEVLDHGLMVDGSHLPFKENISYTKYISSLAHAKGMMVEAELGRLSGTEDDLTVQDYEEKLTDVNQAQEFIDETGIYALAVCIGNVHGKYPASGPKLRLQLLKECIELGVRKFNVNTEVRKAYMDILKSPQTELVHVITAAKEAMKAVVAEKMHLFGSAGKAT